MTEYENVLKDVISNHYETIGLIIAFFAIIAVLFCFISYDIYVWQQEERWEKRAEKRKRKNRKTKSFKAISKRGFLVLKIVGVCGCVLLGFLMCKSEFDEIALVKKDMKNATYVTYTGTFCIGGERVGRRRSSYDTWRTVDMDNEQTVYLFVKNYQDSLYWTENEGLCEGKLVYGKYSEVIVYIEINNKE